MTNKLHPMYIKNIKFHILTNKEIKEYEQISDENYLKKKCKERIILFEKYLNNAQKLELIKYESNDSDFKYSDGYFYFVLFNFDKNLDKCKEEFKEKFSKEELNEIESYWKKETGSDYLYNFELFCELEEKIYQNCVDEEFINLDDIVKTNNYKK